VREREGNVERTGVPAKPELEYTLTDTGKGAATTAVSINAYIVVISNFYYSTSLLVVVLRSSSRY
jgi:hypothetical protein